MKRLLLGLLAALLLVAPAAAQTLGNPHYIAYPAGTTTRLDDYVSGLATTSALAGYQPLDADLTSLAAASSTGAVYYRSATSTWAPLTLTDSTISAGALALSSTISTAHTWSAAQTFSTAPVVNVTAAVGLTLSETLADATIGPEIILRRVNTASAAGTSTGIVLFQSNDSTNVNTTFAEILGNVTDPTDTSEDGTITVATRVAGTLGNHFVFGAGLYAQGQADEGSGTINGALYQNGVDLGTFVTAFTSGGVNGTTNFTPTSANSTYLFTTAITANRAFNIIAGKPAGWRVRVVRTAAATGAFILTVQDSVTTTLNKALSAVAQWVDMVSDGTSWNEAAFGSL